MGIPRTFLERSAPTSLDALAGGIGHGGLASAAVNRRNLKRSVFHPTGSPASISPPFPARTPAGSAPGSSGLCLSCSFDKSLAARGARRRATPASTSPKGQRRVPAARPFGASAHPTGPGNKASGRPGARGPARRSPEPAGRQGSSRVLRPPARQPAGDLGRYCTC